MKSFIVCFVSILIGISAFSQKGHESIDTTLQSYLTYSCATHPEYVNIGPGKCPLCHNAMSLSPKERMQAEVVKLYTCPMHPNVLSTRAGKCPDCKMALAVFKPTTTKKNN